MFQLCHIYFYLFIFLTTKVYASKNREILTCHELDINKIAGNGNDDDEYDPIELWDAAKEVKLINILMGCKINFFFLQFQGDSNCNRKFDNP